MNVIRDFSLTLIVLVENAILSSKNEIMRRARLVSLTIKIMKVLVFESDQTNYLVKEWKPLTKRYHRLYWI